MNARVKLPPVAQVLEVGDWAELPALYERAVAMVWRRCPPVEGVAAAAASLDPFSWTAEVSAQGEGLERLDPALGLELRARLGELVEVHASLFDVPSVGLRLALTDGAMCPAFHVDRVHCRAVWVLAGAGTEWVQGRLPVEPARVVQALPTNAVAWFKGKAWEGAPALVHRSPPVTTRRLVATLDLL